MYTGIEVGVKRILFQTLGLIEPGRKIMIRGQKVNKIKNYRILKEEGIELSVVKPNSKGGFYQKKQDLQPDFTIYVLICFVSCIAHSNRDYISSSIIFSS